MPFLFKRIWENFLLFIFMGVLYFFIYRNIDVNYNTFSLPISHGGFLTLALFVFFYLNYTYFQNIDHLPTYYLTNFTAYAVYMVVFYLIFIADVFDISFIGNIYGNFFKPYLLFTFWNASEFLSSAIIHFVYLIVILIAPFFVKTPSLAPIDEYLAHGEEK